MANVLATHLGASPKKAVRHDMQIDLGWRALEVSSRKGRVLAGWREQRALNKGPSIHDVSVCAAGGA